MVVMGAATTMAFASAALAQASPGFRAKPSQPLAGRNSGFAQTNFVRFPVNRTPLPNVPPVNPPRPTPTPAP